MKYLKSILCVALLSQSISHNTYTLNIHVSRILSAGIGALAAFGTHHMMDSSSTDLKNNFPIVCLVGLVSWGIASSILYESTPEGKLQLSESTIFRITKNPFAQNNYIGNDNSVLYDAIKTYYITHSYWLIAANNEFITYVEQLGNCLRLLDEAMIEKRYDYVFISRCEQLNNMASRAIERLSHNIKIIRAHSEYLEQLKAWNELKIQEQKLALQQQLVHAQQSQAFAQHQQAMAQHQQAHTLNNIARKTSPSSLD